MSASLRAEDVPKEVVAATALALWVVMMRVDPSKMPDEMGLRTIAANVLNAAKGVESSIDSERSR